MTGLEIPIALATALFTAAGVAATGVGSAAAAGALGYKVHQDRKKNKYTQQQVHVCLSSTRPSKRKADNYGSKLSQIPTTLSVLPNR
jgi:uncharacterized membrane protein YebE (DUF533 family)